MIRPLPLAAMAGFLALAPASAANWVEFDDGRVLHVLQVTYREDVAVLALEGGGSIGVPVTRIAATGALPPPIDGTEDSGVPAQGIGGELWRQRAGEYAPLLEATALRHRLDPALLAAVAQVESAFDPLAVSSKGASGMLQLLPETAERFGVENIFDVQQNVEGGARYLRWLLDRYDGDTELALAAYNAGEGAVDRHQGIPPFRETRSYVARVLRGAGLARRR